MKKQKNTYCPKLWEEAFIIENGDVFPCCHRPQIVGNIYNNNLEEIYNSSAFQKMREDSLNGNLRCYKSCTLFNKEKTRPVNRKIMGDYLNEIKKLRLLFSEKCNLNCVMCHQNSKGQKTLDFEVLKKNINLKPFETIDSQGGEPLFIREANQFFDYAVSKGKKVSLLTNCMLINDLWAEKIAVHSDFVHISINATTKEMHERINRGSNWERVLGNIEKIRHFKDKNKTDLDMIGHMTLLIYNLDQIPDFIDNFRDMGFDSINFGFTKSVKYYLKFNFIKRNLLKRKIKDVISRSDEKDKIETFRLKIIGLV